MDIAYSLDEASNRVKSPVILTIGNFEGVHLGHQALLKHVVDTAKKEGKKAAVITFSNHPSEVLRPAQQTPLLCTTEHKLMLIQNSHVDLAIVLPFTKEFSQQSAEQFLQRVQHAVPFKALILGSDAHIGKDREGDAKTIAALAKRIGFTVDYFPDFNLAGQRISSSRIRECIAEGRLKDAEKLLGRSYSIYGKVQKGSGRGAPIGFPTANIAVNKLCLPPQGVYAVALWTDGKRYDGVANLGHAPTVHKDRDAILEVYLFDKNIDLYDKAVDVQLIAFIRPEKRFDTIDALKHQIQDDVAKAKELLHKI